MKPAKVVKVLDVVCSTCFAGIGATCTTSDGKQARAHAIRFEVAGLPVSRRKGTPEGRPRSSAWLVGCSTCGAAPKTPCIGRDHGYHRAREMAGKELQRSEAKA